MDTNILVTYASKYGATREIAEKIGQGLCQAGLQAVVLPVDAVRNLSDYQAVILGSGTYAGQWNSTAAAFLRSNEKILAGRPIWLFTSGPTGEGDPIQLMKCRLPASLEPVADRIRPRDIAVFHGYINPDKLNFFWKWFLKNIIKAPFGDFRDWNAIAAWTGTIAAELKMGVPAPENEG